MEDEVIYYPIVGEDELLHHYDLNKKETACGAKVSEDQPDDIYEVGRFTCNGECLKYSY